MIALPDGDQVLCLSPQARQQRLALGAGCAAARASRAACGNARRNAASVGGLASANRASAGGAPGTSPSFCPAPGPIRPPAPSAMRRAPCRCAAIWARSTLPHPPERRSASSSWLSAGCLDSSAAILASQWRKVRRLSLLQRGHARLQRRQVGRRRRRRRALWDGALLQCRDPRGQRTEVRGLRRRALLQAGDAGLQCAELAHHRIGLVGRRAARRTGIARPRPVPPPGSGSRRRSTRAAAVPRSRRLGRRCGGRFAYRNGSVRLFGRFGHCSSASIASWLGRAATQIRRQGSACNATAAGWPIASASTDRTASCSRAALSRRTHCRAVSAEKNNAAASLPAASASRAASGRSVTGVAA